jgi:MoaA/NifB/PqqE/SkfB family radical SAM enzyme
MCPREQLKRPLGFMPVAFAKKIIDRAVELGVRTVKPQWFGESLIHPSYLEIIEYLKSKNLKVIITTNGSLLKHEMADQLLKLEVDRINFSIDAGSPKIYGMIRRGLNFEEVRKNLVYLKKRRDELGAKIKIQIDCVKHYKFNEEEMRKVFNGVCDNLVFNDLMGTPKNQALCLHQVGSRLVVSCDGKSYLCCHDWLGDYEIGDLNKQDMKEIWLGEKRENFLTNLQYLAICQKCM